MTRHHPWSVPGAMRRDHFARVRYAPNILDLLTQEEIKTRRQWMLSSLAREYQLNGILIETIGDAHHEEREGFDV